jgi:hypothetical protein
VGGLELEREFGLVRIVGVFMSRTTAEELQRLLNARGKPASRFCRRLRDGSLRRRVHGRPPLTS